VTVVSPPQTIPVIDLAAALAGDHDARAEVARQLDTSCQEIGFFCVSGHGVPATLIADVVEVAEAFFDQPDEVKAGFLSPTGNTYRGWSCRELAGPDGPVRLREHIEMGTFDTPADILAAGYDQEWADRTEPNIWPSPPQELETVWKSYFAVMADLGRGILSLMAEALDLPSDWFADKFDRETSYLSANKYPAARALVENNGVRLGRHTDIGSLTLLYQDDGPGGLQVLDRSGDWCDVPFQSGTFIVNLGDLLAKWTNDRWVATPHQVLTTLVEETRSRLSVPYFQHPNFDALIECLPTCASPDEPPRYPAVLSGNWADYRFKSYEPL
jgi:isopenicillin N synthase-like dioxygenase